MRVINQFGREIEMSQENYDKFIEMGKTFQILKPMMEEAITKTDNVIYTAICGKYPIERKDIICFGDEGIFKNPVMEAKRYKILPHLFFPEKEVTIWVDANVWLKVSNNEAINKFLGDADIAVFKHPFRKNAYEEFNTLRTQERFKGEWLQSQLGLQQKSYEDVGFPLKSQLCECNFLIRRNNEAVNNLMDKWWAQT